MNASMVNVRSVRTALALIVIGFLIALAHPVAAQRPPTLSGAVVDASGAAITGATVTVLDGSGKDLQRLVTDAAGNFTVPGLRPGRYVVQVEQRLFSVSRQTIDLSADREPVPLRFVLTVASLRETVSVSAPGAYSRPTATAATRFEADSLVVPQSSQEIVSTLIDDMGAVDLGDVLKVVPSAMAGHTRLAPFTSFSWRIRGLDAAVTRNGFRQLYFEDVDQSAFANVDRVEVIKGPGGAVYGKEGLGGIVHVVTKRPGQQLSASAFTSLGQYAMRTVGGDVTGPVGDSGLSVRLNGEIERSDTFVNFQKMDRNNVAFAASWDKQTRVRAFLNVEYQQRNTLPHPGLPPTGTVIPNGAGEVTRETYLGEPNNVDYLKTWSPLSQAWADIDLGRGWTLSPRYQHFTFNVDQQQMQLRAPLASNPSLIQRTGRYDFHERDKTHAFQLEVKGKADWGSTTHQLIAGYEIDRHSYLGDWFNYASAPPINALNPSYLSAPPTPGAAKVSFSGDIDTYEPYVQDLITWNKISVLAGIRRTQVNIDSEFGGFLTPDQNHGGNSYQVGASYRINPTVSLFAGASTGLSVDNIGGATSADGTPFEPERSRQVEVGVKHQSGRLSGSVAFFNILFENATTGDPNNPDFALQIGEQRSRGVEADTSWQASNRVFLTGGLAVIDATITESNDGDVGNRLGNIARVQANVWGHFQLHSDVVAGVGANFVGRRFGTISNTYELPRYGTVDASVGWQIARELRAEFFVQNLFDQTYYTGNNNNALYPGEPRTAYVRLRANVGRR
ncbi:MAG: TonB-dependent receptor [Vicinamibacterales bacterium]